MKALIERILKEKKEYQPLSSDPTKSIMPKAHNQAIDLAVKIIKTYEVVGEESVILNRIYGQSVTNGKEFDPQIIPECNFGKLTQTISQDKSCWEIKEK